MKTKFKISNRLLSLVLAFVMVLGMLPILTVNAAISAAYTNAVSKENRIYTIKLNSFMLSDEESLSTVQNCAVTNYSRSGSKVTLRIKIVYRPPSSSRNTSIDANLSFDDGECTTELAEITRNLYNPSSYAQYGVFSIKRNAIAHTGTATCTTPATCTRCGVTFGTTNNSHNWGSWISNQNGTHTRTCTYNSNHKENGNCSGGKATCDSAPTCSACGKEYDSKLGHSYQYSASTNVITETCKNNCGHSKTATLTAADTTYTGSPITTGASIAYDEGWVGDKPQPVVSDYSNNTNAGTATVTTTVEGKELTTTFKINPADISGATVTFDPESAQYTGGYHRPSVTVTLDGFGTLEFGRDYVCSGSEGVDNENKPSFQVPGDYTLDIEGQNNFTGRAKATYTVANGKMEGVDVTCVEELTYTGRAQTLDPYVSTSSLFPDVNGITFTYSTEENGSYSSGLPSLTDAGTHTVYYKASHPYCDEKSGSFKVVIHKATNAWNNEPTVSDWIYGETPNVTQGEALFGTVKVVYTGEANDGSDYNSEAAPTQAGSYTATFTVTGNSNYTGLEKVIDFEIKKDTYDMSDAKWDYTTAFDYDGLEKTVSVTGLPSGVSVKEYSGNTKTAVGNYTAKVTLSYDGNNYNDPSVDDLAWSIKNDWTPTNEYTVSTPNSNGWLKDDLVVTAMDGYELSLTNTANGVWSKTLTGAVESTDSSITFFVRDKADGTISLAKIENYKLDKTNPTGTVEFVGREPWQEFVNTITFGLFFKDEVTVKAEATDALSGVASIAYYEADEEKTLDEVKAITEWTAMPENGVGVTVEDAKKFVYFIRITDKAGNVTYLSTDGAEYDTTRPAIIGIENGKTYYTTQRFTVMERNLESVTVNGYPSMAFALGGNVDKEYVIIATDKAGNVTEYTVTMKTIADLAEATNDLSNDNVTSADAPALVALVENLDELIADDDVTDGERETLEQHKAIAEGLLDTVEDAAEATTSENTEKVKDITADNVTPEDKTDLEKAKADLEKALDTYSGNYTEDEKKAIGDEIKRIDDALEAIGNADEVEELIGKLPENITKNDGDTIKTADDAYNALSDHEKSLVDKDAKKALDDAKAALAELNKSASDNMGDTTKLELWFALLVISGCAVIALTVVDRRKRKMAK